MDSLLPEILKFVKDRDWDQFHNPKDLAISISIEANELLECFQWKDDRDLCNLDFESIEDEIADVYIYLLMLSSKLNIDIINVAHKKLDKNAIKYPVEKCKGFATKYTDL